MIRALVVYESMFGNTEAVARAVAGGLASRMDVEVRPVDAVPELLDEPALLVVGGPTHAMGMSRPSTREDAVRQGARPTATATGLREWLAALPAPPAGTLGAAFDTRVHSPLPGSAARRAARRLRRSGVGLVAPATTFWVTGTGGPLVAGELERARRWGAQLAEATVTAAASLRR